MSCCCCYCFKLRWGVATFAILMFALYVSSPWLPYESPWLPNKDTWKFPNPEIKDYFLSIFGCLMCAILFSGAIVTNVWLTFLGFIGYCATILAILILLWTPGETTCFSYFDVRKYPVLVSIHFVSQFYYICVTGVYWYKILREDRSIIKPHLVPSS